jgi:hypothetical protein
MSEAENPSPHHHHHHHHDPTDPIVPPGHHKHKLHPAIAETQAIDEENARRAEKPADNTEGLKKEYEKIDRTCKSEWIVNGLLLAGFIIFLALYILSVE